MNFSQFVKYVSTHLLDRPVHKIKFWNIWYTFQYVSTHDLDRSTYAFKSWHISDFSWSNLFISLPLIHAPKIPNLYISSWIVKIIQLALKIISYIHYISSTINFSSNYFHFHQFSLFHLQKPFFTQTLKIHKISLVCRSSSLVCVFMWLCV